MRALLFTKDNKRWRVRAKKIGTNMWMHVNGETWVIDQKPKVNKKSQSQTSTEDENQILAPMPGKILRVLTRLGEKVEKNQVLIVMEAMKMEYSLQAPCAGTVEVLEARELQQVELGRMLVSIKI